MQLNNTGSPRVLGSIVRLLIASVGLAVASAAYAQSGLPPEARARVVIVEVERALAAKDEAAALSKLKELRGLPLPAALYVIEAKLAGRAKDYVRSRKALDDYFKAAPATDGSYQEASEIYASLNSLEQKADASDWNAANAIKTCDAYTNYLVRPNSKKSFVPQTAAAMDTLACPKIDDASIRSSMDYETSNAFWSTMVSFSDADKHLKLAKLAARSRTLANAAAATGIAGRWRAQEDFEKEDCVKYSAYEVTVKDGKIYAGYTTQDAYLIDEIEGGVLMVHQERLFEVGRKPLLMEATRDRLTFNGWKYRRCRG